MCFMQHFLQSLCIMSCVFQKLLYQACNRTWCRLYVLLIIKTSYNKHITFVHIVTSKLHICIRWNRIVYVRKTTRENLLYRHLAEKCNSIIICAVTNTFSLLPFWHPLIFTLTLLLSLLPYSYCTTFYMCFQNIRRDEWLIKGRITL